MVTKPELALFEVRPMGRPTIYEIAMTPRERQRRRRAKLAEIVHAEHVLANLSRAYGRA
jgi:hypothetical protein